jgi:predicted restriction endonuclease
VNRGRRDETPSSRIPPASDAELGKWLLETVGQLHIWRRGQEHAVSKPLLVLLALGRLRQGLPRLVGFVEIEAPLRVLLRLFGPDRRSQHPEYPFWHSMSDGLWEVEGADALPLKQGGCSPTASTLRRSHAAGGLAPRVFEYLASKPDFVRVLTETILATYFPPALHASILTAVGLSAGGG